jgi:uncharacterized protein (TIGR03435 family)
MAYNIRPPQLSGAPNWVNTARFDINAKVDDAFIEELKKMEAEERRKQSNLLLQSLLAERFDLKVSHTTKELPVYWLVVAKGGPKIQESRPDPKGPETNVSSHGGGPVQMEAKGLTMAMFAESLSRQVDRTVLDQTGLTGRYDFTLQWSRDQDQGAIFKATDDRSGAASTPPPDSSSPTIFTAIREQLGLKLESTKGPVDILVIEHIEMPSAD